MDPAKWIFLLFLLVFLGRRFSVAVENATVDAEAIQIIRDGQLMVSNNKNFALGFFGFGNSTTRRYVGIWYNNIPEKTLVWVANRNQPLKDNSGTFAIDRRGNIVIYSIAQNISLWSTNVSIPTTNDTLIKLLDTGNLVVMQLQSLRRLWESFDYPSNSMIPYSKIGLNRRTGFSWSLTSWRAEDDPGIGNFTCRIDPTGYPQLVVYKGNVPWWRGGPWTGRRWSGIPQMIRSFRVNASYIDSADEVSITDSVAVDTVLTRLSLNESGFLYRSTWQEQERTWVEYWSPTEWCDKYNRCNSNSNCDPYISDQFPCQCLPGFDPKSPGAWSSRDVSGGCIRKKENSTCRSGEGFVKVPLVKVPDTSTARADKSMNLEACEEACLKDCNCTAYTSADEMTGMGCITWYGDLIDTRTNANVGQDLYVRVDAVVLAQYAYHSNRRSKKKMVAIGVVSAVAVLLVVASVIFFTERRRKRRKRSETLDSFGDSPNPKESDGSRRTSDLPVFDLSNITKATDNFSTYNKLGEGGFGSVYKGKLKSGEEIAVKRLAKNSRQGVGEFRNEVTLIAKLQHINLVRIVGYCVQHEEKMLVYEYLPNKSLDTFIFDESKRKLLDWTKRFEIIGGIARGILYLHQDSRLKIIHRDLKASNVLLDADLNPKIADFGMARIFEKDQIQANTNRIVGTLGYMSPEYAMGGLFSVKSDVYSFGVLVLEIITGRKNISCVDDFSYLNLIGHVWELWKLNKAMEMIDSCLNGSSSANEIMRCIQIGLLCVQEDSTDRPTMSTVVSMLGNEVALPSPKNPAFILKRKYSHGNPSTSTEGASSVNDVTVTLEAR